VFLSSEADRVATAAALVTLLALDGSLTGPRELKYWLYLESGSLESYIF